jgi:hypothetical protein
MARGSRRVGATIPVGIELLQEQSATLNLVEFADLQRGSPKTIKGTKEPAVGLMTPTHISRSTPTRSAQTIKPAVVPDSGVRISLGRVTTNASQLSPTIEAARVRSDHRTEHGPPLLNVGLIKRCCNRHEGRSRLGIKDGLRNSSAERDRAVGHRFIVSRGTGHAWRMAETPVEAEFFFDPICPWAWITSRWVGEVVEHAGISVSWRFIALRFVNEHRYGNGLDESYRDRHHTGLSLLRVCADGQARHGDAIVWDLYTAFGTRIHVEQNVKSLLTTEGIAQLLTNRGLPAELAEASTSDVHDAAIRASTDQALERTGKDVGTPIITYGPPDGPSLFGPVINAAPKGAEAVELWGHVAAIARDPRFSELKRSLRGAPRFD